MLTITKGASKEALQLLVCPLHLTVSLGVVSGRQTNAGVDQMKVGTRRGWRSSGLEELVDLALAQLVQAWTKFLVSLAIPGH